MVQISKMSYQLGGGWEFGRNYISLYLHVCIRAFNTALKSLGRWWLVFSDQLNDLKVTSESKMYKKNWSLELSSRFHDLLP